MLKRVVFSTFYSLPRDNTVGNFEPFGTGSGTLGIKSFGMNSFSIRSFAIKTFGITVI